MLRLSRVKRNQRERRARERRARFLKMDRESLSFCEICAERKEMIKLDGCSHSFCRDCISKHLTTKIKQNVKLIPCLGYNCGGILDLDSCKRWISPDLALMWEEAICKSMIPESQMYYCPFSDCSVMMVNDSDEKETIKEAECPLCHRLFCVQCRVPFHVGIECEEFMMLDKDERGLGDLLVRELAAKNKWMRCPNCRFFVEKKEGCLHITCRCGFEFCYACGAKWSSSHGGCGHDCFNPFFFFLFYVAVFNFDYVTDILNIYFILVVFKFS